MQFSSLRFLLVTVVLSRTQLLSAEAEDALLQQLHGYARDFRGGDDNQAFQSGFSAGSQQSGNTTSAVPQSGVENSSFVYQSINQKTGTYNFTLIGPNQLKP